MTFVVIMSCTKLGDNYLFLYNYAAELNYGKYYNQSQEMAEQCSELGLIIIYNC